MKAIIATQDLREALKKACPIKPRRELPVLSNALLECKDGKMTLTTSDLERIVKVNLIGSADGEFQALLPLKTVGKFLYGANGNVDVGIGKSPKNLELKRDAGQLSMETLLPSDFPKKVEAESLVWSSLDVKWFCRMLGIVVTACADDDTRPILTGVCCHDGAIASADGFRLVVLKDDRLKFGLGDSEVVIPALTCNLIRRLFGRQDTVEVAFDKQADEVKAVYFRSGEIWMHSDVIQGKYPKIMQLIPDGYDCKVSFSAPVMAQRLGMVDDIGLSGGIIRFIFGKKEDSGEHECVLEGGDKEFGYYSLAMPIKIEDGEDSKIAFNIKYIRDAVKYFSVATLELTSISSPGKFTGDIEGLTVVVMPMYVQW